MSMNEFIEPYDFHFFRLLRRFQNKIKIVYNSIALLKLQIPHIPNKLQAFSSDPSTDASPEVE